jgi:uncharacterized protein (TIGR02391 family)
MLITGGQVDELLAKLSDLSGLDEELVKRCGLLIRSERYDEAVSRAFVVLEERLRGLLGLRGGTGADLSQRAFAPKTGQLAGRLYLPPAEIEGIRDLFVGAFRAFRNRAAHTVAGYGLDEARAIIQLVNLLLLILEEVRQAPVQQVPEKMARLLGPAARERLQMFLQGLQDIGIGRGQGKEWTPYRATLKRYLGPSWEEPRPHQVSILYLSVVADRPIVAFNSGGLSQVVGLDVTQLEGKLIQAGCRRTAAKSTPIRLLLDEHNNQSTFDRLYEILRDLMEKHRA